MFNVIHLLDQQCRRPSPGVTYHHCRRHHAGDITNVVTSSASCSISSYYC